MLRSDQFRFAIQHIFFRRTEKGAGAGCIGGEIKKGLLEVGLEGVDKECEVESKKKRETHKGSFYDEIINWHTRLC